ncbi:hypothetical protein F4775DRAFT_578496 [Biscogniauxia sp. FL1348]|nr:hypothetical protein F4775DRAFT_578496 [Biscogniauxia sp. FL1348]
MADVPPGTDLSQIPLAPNPNGDPPNFDGGATLQLEILATGIVFITISLIFVIVRLGTSLKSTRKLHLDDYFCLLGELAGVAYWFVFYELQVKQGIAKHSWDIPVSIITPTLIKGQSAARVLASVASVLVKSSILLFFVRLFGTLRWVRIFCYGLLVATLVLYGAYLVALLSLCIPARGQPWDSTLITRCATALPGTITISVFAVIIDTAMFIMPFFIIAGLHTRADKKKGLAIVFLFGFLIVVTSVVVLAYRVSISSGTVDSIWTGAKISITSYIEIFGTVIVSCTPALSSFWFNIFIKSNLYSSLPSRFSLLRLRGRSTPGGSAPRPPAAAEYCSKCEHCHPFKRLHTPSSTQELVEPPMIPLQSIQKSTLIIQHSSDDVYDTHARQDLQRKTKNIVREEW